LWCGLLQPGQSFLDSLFVLAPFPRSALPEVLGNLCIEFVLVSPIHSVAQSCEALVQRITLQGSVVRRLFLVASEGFLQTSEHVIRYLNALKNFPKFLGNRKFRETRSRTFSTVPCTAIINVFSFFPLSGNAAIIVRAGQ
jgi:hypothetical protein